jgi:hypothetical protein
LFAIKILFGQAGERRVQVFSLWADGSSFASRVKKRRPFEQHFTLLNPSTAGFHRIKCGTRVVLHLTKGNMPEKQTLERARRDKRRGKAASTQAGEFVREEMHHIREGKHGARSSKQAIAIGLSKARRAGVKLRPPRKGQASAKTRKSATSAYRKGQRGQKPSRTRSRARLNALKHEGHAAASPKALSRQARSAARRRGPAKRRMAARKAARTRSQERWNR